MACVRQIAASSLRNAGADVTRNTVLKSVCVLCELVRTYPAPPHAQPLYGLLFDHMSSTTEVLFAQQDFSEKELLQSLFLRCLLFSPFEHLASPTRHSFLFTTSIE